MSYYKFTVISGHRNGEIISASLHGHWKPEALLNWANRHNYSDPSAAHHTYDMSGHGRSDCTRVLFHNINL